MAKINILEAGSPIPEEAPVPQKTPEITPATVPENPPLPPETPGNIPAEEPLLPDIPTEVPLYVQ
ncbi:MAG: hypothetical protein ABIS01_08365 [Ferruginibacter sp.]